MYEILYNFNQMDERANHSISNLMCYNCGCKKPNDAHGKKENIVNDTIRNAANAMGMNFADSIKNIRELTEIEITEHSHGPVHGHEIDHDHDHDHSEK